MADAAGAPPAPEAASAGARPAASSEAWPLAEPPGPPRPGWRTAFGLLNRWCMTPALRVGLGAWMGMPAMGYLLLLRVRGRKTGILREVPLNYLVAEGSIWILSGFGQRSEWYRNLLAASVVEVLLPAGPVRCAPAEVRDPGVRARIIPRLIRVTAVPSLMTGLNPFAGDERLLDEMAWVPLLRLDPLEGWLEPGADDPGGRAWVWRQGLVAAVSLGTAAAAVGMARRLSRRRAR